MKHDGDVLAIYDGLKAHKFSGEVAVDVRLFSNIVERLHGRDISVLHRKLALVPGVSRTEACLKQLIEEVQNELEVLATYPNKMGKIIIGLRGLKTTDDAYLLEYAKQPFAAKYLEKVKG